MRPFKRIIVALALALGYCTPAPAKAFVLVLAFLCACGRPHDAAESDNHGYGFGYDLVADDGLRFRDDILLTPLTQTEMLARVDDVYKGVEQCMGLSYPGPLVVLVDTKVLTPYWSYTYFHDAPLVLLIGAVVLAEYLPAQQHEYVHYLLVMSGYPDDLNATHQSPFFLQCSGLAS